MSQVDANTSAAMDALLAALSSMGPPAAAALSTNNTNHDAVPALDEDADDEPFAIEVGTLKGNGACGIGALLAGGASATLRNAAAPSSSQCGNANSGGGAKSLESLMMALGKQLQQNRAHGNGDDWVGKPTGGSSKPLGAAVGTVASSSSSCAADDDADGAMGGGDGDTLDDLVIKAQRQLREGGEAGRIAMAASSNTAAPSSASSSSAPLLAPPKSKAEYDAMSLNELCEEFSKIGGLGKK